MRGFFSRDDNIIIDITHAAKHHSHLLLHSALAAGYSAGCAARSFLIVYSPGPQGGKSKDHASCELSGQSDRKEAPVLFLEKMAVELEQTHMMDAYRKTHDLRVLLPAISDNEIRCKIEELAHLLMVNSFDKANIVAGQIKGALKTRDVGILQTILEEAMELLNVQNRCARSIAYSRFHLQNGNYDRALMMLRETVYEYVQIAALGESKIEMSDSELKRFHDYLKKNKELRKQYQKLNNLRKICAHAAGNTVDPYSKKSEETLNDPKKLKSFLEEAILFWERAFLSTR
jgi:hypothetical protein